MISIAVSAAILSFIMYIVAKHEADYDFLKVFIISLVISVVDFVLFFVVDSPIINIVVMTGLTVWLLQQFCYLPWKKAAIVTAIYVVVMSVITYTVLRVTESDEDFDLEFEEAKIILDGRLKAVA